MLSFTRFLRAFAAMHTLRVCAFLLKPFVAVIAEQRVVHVGIAAKVAALGMFMAFADTHTL